MKQGQYKITKEEQLKELTERIPPVVNVDVVVVRKNEYLLGHRNTKERPLVAHHGWLFPGGRMRYTETPQEAALRILNDELPGVQAILKRLITVLSDKGYDYRANGVTIYYLFEHVSGEPIPNSQLDNFRWVTSVSVADVPDMYEVEQRIFDEIDREVRMMNMHADELLVEVDKDNKEIGVIEKRLAHSINTRYHRAAHMMIFNSNGEVVLQKRSMNKITIPGMWDMHGGHQALGQTIEQCAKAELMEELGIETMLTLKRVGLQEDNHQAEYYYLYYGVSDGPYGYDRNEVDQIKNFDCEKLLAGGYDQEYGILPHVKEYTEELRDVWEAIKNS